jgi:hypothetical protein
MGDVHRRCQMPVGASASACAHASTRRGSSTGQVSLIGDVTAHSSMGRYGFVPWLEPANSL